MRRTVASWEVEARRRRGLPTEAPLLRGREGGARERACQGVRGAKAPRVRLSCGTFRRGDVAALESRSADSLVRADSGPGLPRLRDVHRRRHLLARRDPPVARAGAPARLRIRAHRVGVQRGRAELGVPWFHRRTDERDRGPRRRQPAHLPSSHSPRVRRPVARHGPGDLPARPGLGSIRGSRRCRRGGLGPGGALNLLCAPRHERECRDRRSGLGRGLPAGLRLRSGQGLRLRSGQGLRLRSGQGSARLSPIPLAGRLVARLVGPVPHSDGRSRDRRGGHPGRAQELARSARVSRRSQRVGRRLRRRRCAHLE